MRFLFRLLCSAALSAFPLVGCSSDGGSGGSGGGGGSATAELRLFVQSYDPPAPNMPLEGVEVCQTATDNCVNTDAYGNAIIELPSEREVSFTMDAEGHGSYLTPYILPATGAAEAFVIATEQRLDEMHQLVGSPYPMEGTGSLYVDVVTDPGGITFALVNGTGKPFYRDEDKDWDPELTATTTGGGGGFTEVAPGVVQVDIAEAGCIVVRGWPGDQANRIKFPITEAYLSRIEVSCAVP